jgi:phosphoenolpyruvate carboxykinase (ATP)
MDTKVKTDLAAVLSSGEIHYNLSVAELVEAAITRKEGKLTINGAFAAETGKYTGRSPKDKFIVDEPTVKHKISWGNVNRPISTDNFEKLYYDVLEYLTGKDLFVFDGFAGADPSYRLPIRVINEYAWHNLFAHQLFVRPSSNKEVDEHQAEFTVLSAPGFEADPKVHGTNSETFIIVSFEKKVVLIGGTKYAGEMKKSIFSVMNFLLPELGVLSMHCSANVSEEGNVALFFGLSGTGKTTLSADPNRRLIGDDEHGWSNRGVFNIEGGCYAKTINLSLEKEPQIWNAVRFGTVLENVFVRSGDRNMDYDDASLTENTRAAYPVDYIPGALIPGVAGHPDTIIFLTADAFGVLPPITKLTKAQAMYHFLSGYTSKLAGTERGVTEPESTFSTCFGSPFLPLHPGVYAKMLGEKISEKNAKVYLVNTGWSGGPYGVGKRMNLKYTRAMVNAAIRGALESVSYTQDPIFGLHIPREVPGVPGEILEPRNTWDNKAEYDKMAKELAASFVNNFAKFTEISEEIKQAGPKVDLS